LRVGLLAREELANQLLHISHLSSGLNGLESIVDILGAFHFFLHLLAHEGVPEFVDVELLAEDEFTGVLVLVGSGLSDFSIATLALDAALDGLFLVLNALLKFNNALLSILLLLLDVEHERVEDGLRLETVLLGLAVLVAFQVEDLSLGLDRDLELVGLKARGDVIAFHTLEHVSVGGLGHLFLVDAGLSLVESLAQLLETGLNLVDGSLKLLLLLRKLVDFLASAVKFVFLGINEFLGFVVLLLNAVQLDAHLADFLSLVLGGGVVVVGFEQGVHVNGAFGTIVNTTGK